MTLHQVFVDFAARQKRLANPLAGPALAGALVRVAFDWATLPLRVVVAGIDGAAEAHRAVLNPPGAAQAADSQKEV